MTTVPLHQSKSTGPKKLPRMRRESLALRYTDTLLPREPASGQMQGWTLGVSCRTLCPLVQTGPRGQKAKEKTESAAFVQRLPRDGC